MDFIGTADACEQTHLSMMPGDPAYKGPAALYGKAVQHVDWVCFREWSRKCSF